MEADGPTASEDTASGEAVAGTTDEYSYLEDELPSALTRPGDFPLAEGIPILPHLPKYSICIQKGPSEFLGTMIDQENALHVVTDRVNIMNPKCFITLK